MQFQENNICYDYYYYYDKNNKEHTASDIHGQILEKIIEETSE